MTTRFYVLLASLAAANVFGFAAPAHATEPSAAPVGASVAAAITPAEHFEIGATLVERHGERGTPLILIPGLSSGSWVWQDTVRQLKNDHVLYVLTFPGFDGRPAVTGKLMELAEQSVIDLIAARKLVKPVLIGHSLGATLSISLAAHRSELLGGVIAIDGLPVFPFTDRMAPEQRPQMAENMKTRMKSSSQEQFAAQQLKYMQTMGVIDPAKAAELAVLSARSDPTATMQYMVEDVILDLRAGLPKISVPVLLISPYYASDLAAMKISEADKTAYYTALMAGTPKLQVVSISPARHFAMIDQPKMTADAIGNYLKTLPTQ